VAKGILPPGVEYFPCVLGGAAVPAAGQGPSAVLLETSVAPDWSKMAPEPEVQGSSAGAQGSSEKQEQSPSSVASLSSVSLLTSANWTGKMGSALNVRGAVVSLAKQSSSADAAIRCSKGTPEGQKLRWRIAVKGKAPKKESDDTIFLGVSRARFDSPSPDVAGTTNAVVVNCSTGAVFRAGEQIKDPSESRVVPPGEVAEFVLEMTPLSDDVAASGGDKASNQEPGATSAPGTAAEASGGGGAGDDEKDGKHPNEGSRGRLWMRTSKLPDSFEIIDDTISLEYAGFPCAFLRGKDSPSIELISKSGKDLSKVAKASRSSNRGIKQELAEMLDSISSSSEWTTASRAVDEHSFVGECHVVNNAKYGGSPHVSSADDDTAPVVSLGKQVASLVGSRIEPGAMHLKTSISSGRMCVEVELVRDMPNDQGSLVGFSKVTIPTASYSQSNHAVLVRSFNGEVLVDGTPQLGQVQALTRHRVLRPGSRMRLYLDLFDGTCPGIMAVQVLPADDSASPAASASPLAPQGTDISMAGLLGRGNPFVPSGVPQPGLHQSPAWRIFPSWLFVREWDSS